MSARIEWVAEENPADYNFVNTSRGAVLVLCIDGRYLTIGSGIMRDCVEPLRNRGYFGQIPMWMRYSMPHSTDPIGRSIASLPSRKLSRKSKHSYGSTCGSSLRL